MYARLRNMSAHVENFDGANSGVVTNEHAKVYPVSGIALYSYDSLVAVYDTVNKVIYMLPHWDYSTTTSKHVHAFIQDYTELNDISYKDIRRSFNDKDSSFVECVGWDNGRTLFTY